MNKVAVIMSTYNGERYLREQIDSILAQENVNLKLIIRDDGSKDATTTIIEEYCKKYNNVIFQNRNRIKNLGIKNSFLTLLSWALTNYIDIEFFAFSDQDDYWEPRKLSAALDKYDGSKSWLYFSNKKITDQNLNYKYTERINYIPDILEVFWGPQASGCTMLINRELTELVIRHWDKSSIIAGIHDSIIYRVAKATNSTVCFDHNAYILYRQHERNVVGIDKTVKTSENWKGLFRKSPHYISELAKAIRANYATELSDEGEQYLRWVSTYRKNIKARWRLILDKKAIKRGPKMYMIWVGKLLLRRL